MKFIFKLLVYIGMTIVLWSYKIDKYSERGKKNAISK